MNRRDSLVILVVSKGLLVALGSENRKGLRDSGEDSRSDQRDDFITAGRPESPGQDSVVSRRPATTLLWICTSASKTSIPRFLNQTAIALVQ